jgi:predicted RNA-binding protein with PUA-like domain
MGHYWIFQSRPDRYDLRKDSVLQPGKTEPWIASRYRSLMQPGDMVYFWLSGEPEIRGIYGKGHLISEPYSRGDEFLVDVQYDEKFTNPITIQEIESRSELREMQIVRIPIGTNFLLEDGEIAALNRLEGAAA